jgi:hypothetical protein
MIDNKFFVQKVQVNTGYKKLDRFDFLLNFVKNKSVLHVGFVDYPITDVSTNLHLKLAKECNIIDGIDPNLNDDISKLLSVSNGVLYSSWEEISNKNYDVILVPEVIEHVDNLKSFFELLDTINGTLIITAPDAYLFRNSFQEINDPNFNFQEFVHPDHNCWFSPYTLKNVINKYSNKKVKDLYWIKGSIVAICK